MGDLDWGLGVQIPLPLLRLCSGLASVSDEDKGRDRKGQEGTVS